MRHRAPRRGTAIVAALALVTLAAALLASAAAAASAGARAVLSERAALQAESAARRTLAITLASWPASYDQLEVGQSLARELTYDAALDTVDLPVHGRLCVERLGRTLFAVSVDVRVGASTQLARRRVRLLAQRLATSDSSRASVTPVPIARWSMADLY